MIIVIKVITIHKSIKLKTQYFLGSLDGHQTQSDGCFFGSLSAKNQEDLLFCLLPTPFSKILTTALFLLLNHTAMWTAGGYLLRWGIKDLKFNTISTLGKADGVGGGPGAPKKSMRVS